MASMQVKNARLRLSNYTGAQSAGVVDGKPNPAGDIGRPSFQDVCRLLMAVQLDGADRHPGSPYSHHYPPCHKTHTHSYTVCSAILRASSPIGSGRCFLAHNPLLGVQSGCRMH